MLLSTAVLSLLSLVAAAPCCRPSAVDVNIFSKNVCLDNKDGKVQEGNPVQLWECEEATANWNQKWTFTVHPLDPEYPQIRLAGTNMCLSGGSAPADGSPLVIESCMASNASTTFEPRGHGLKLCLKGNNYCIDMEEGDSSNGRLLQFWTGYTDNPNQEWSVGAACA